MASGSIALSRPRDLDGPIVRLDLYRAVRALKASAKSVTVPAPHAGGFETSIHAAGGRVSLSLDGLVQDFDTLEEAVDWAVRAQLPDRRLRIEYAGRHPVQWALEHIREDGSVECELACGRPFLIASLLHRRVEYRYNASIPSHMAQSLP